MTLIEVLVTITIMGVVFTIFVGGLGLAIFGSDVNNRQASAASSVKSAAESVKASGYTPCATAVDFVLPNPPTGFTWDPIVVSYWNGTDDFDGTCSVPNDDKGLQRITLKVTSTRTLPNAEAGQQQVVASEIQVVKRNPDA